MSSVKRVAVSNVRMPRSPQHDVVVALGGHVVARRQPFGDRPRETALVQDHLARLGGHLADLAQQAEVLEVARAHLQTVHVRMNQLAMSRIHDLGQGLEPQTIARALHDLQGLFAKTLERMRVRARLERTAANPGQPQIGDALGNLVELLLGLNRARTCVNGDLVAALSEIGNGEMLTALIRTGSPS